MLVQAGLVLINNSSRARLTFCLVSCCQHKVCNEVHACSRGNKAGTSAPKPACLLMLCCPLQSRRFAATLGELTGGRVGLTCGSVGVLKGAITIAIRYSAGRQQFGPPDSPEVSPSVGRGRILQHQVLARAAFHGCSAMCVN